MPTTKNTSCNTMMSNSRSLSAPGGFEDFLHNTALLGGGSEGFHS